MSENIPTAQKDYENTVERHQQERELYTQRSDRFIKSQHLLMLLLGVIAIPCLTGEIPGVKHELTIAATIFLKALFTFVAFFGSLASFVQGQDMYAAVKAEMRIKEYWEEREYNERFPPPALVDSNGFSFIRTTHLPYIMSVIWLLLIVLFWVFIP